MQPTQFIASWRHLVDATRESITIRSKYAFVFSPMTPAFGYPFGEVPPSSLDFTLLDTNKDGKVDIADDPYSPFYPGNDYVDWVGTSVLHLVTSGLLPNNQGV